MIHGYLRVSTDQQDERRQKEALNNHKVDHYYCCSSNNMIMSKSKYMTPIYILPEKPFTLFDRA